MDEQQLGINVVADVVEAIESLQSLVDMLSEIPRDVTTEITIAGLDEAGEAAEEADVSLQGLGETAASSEDAIENIDPTPLDDLSSTSDKASNSLGETADAGTDVDLSLQQVGEAAALSGTALVNVNEDAEEVDKGLKGVGSAGEEAGKGLGDVSKLSDEGKAALTQLGQAAVISGYSIHGLDDNLGGMGNVAESAANALEVNAISERKIGEAAASSGNSVVNLGTALGNVKEDAKEAGEEINTGLKEVGSVSDEGKAALTQLGQAAVMSGYSIKGLDEDLGGVGNVAESAADALETNAVSEREIGEAAASSGYTVVNLGTALGNVKDDAEEAGESGGHSFEDLRSSASDTFSSMKSGASDVVDSMSVVNGSITQLVAAYGALTIASTAYTGAAQSEANQVMLSRKYGDQGKTLQSEIMNTVASVPADDTYTNQLLTQMVYRGGAVDQGTMKNWSSTIADYLSGQQAAGHLPATSQRDLQNYILTGNTLDMQRASILRDQLDTLKGQATVSDRMNALQKALNADGYAGMSTMDTLQNKATILKGEFQKATTNLGLQMVPTLKSIVNMILGLDEKTHGWSTEFLVAGAFVAALVGTLGLVAAPLKAGLSVIKTIGGGLKSVITTTAEWVGKLGPVKSALSSIKDTLGSIIDTIKNVAKSIGDWISNLGKVKEETEEAKEAETSVGEAAATSKSEDAAAETADTGATEANSAAKTGNAAASEEAATANTERAASEEEDICSIAANTAATDANTGALEVGTVATDEAAESQGLLDAVMDANPIVLIVLAIVALTAGLIYLWETNKGFRDFVTGAWNDISGAIGGAVKAAGADIGAFIGDVEALPGEIGTALAETAIFFLTLPGQIASALGKFGSEVISFFTQLPGRLASGLTKAAGDVAWWSGYIIGFGIKTGMNFVSGTIRFFTQLPGRIASTLMNTLHSITSWATNTVNAGVHTGQQFVTNTSRFFTQLPGRIQGYLTQTLTRITSWAVRTGAAATRAGQQFLTNTARFFAQLPGRIWTYLVQTITQSERWAVQLGQNAIKAGQNVVNGTVGEIRRLPGQIWNFFAQSIADIVRFAGTAATDAKNIGSNIYHGIIDNVTKIPEEVKKEIDDIIGAIKNAGQDIYNAAAWLGQKAVGGFNAGMDRHSPGAMYHATVDEISSMRNAITSSNDSFNSAAQGLGDSIVSGFQSTADHLFSVGQSMISKLSSGIESGIPDLSSVFSQISNMFPHNPPKTGPLSTITTANMKAWASSLADAGVAGLSKFKLNNLTLPEIPSVSLATNTNSAGAGQTVVQVIVEKGAVVIQGNADENVVKNAGSIFGESAAEKLARQGNNRGYSTINVIR